MIASAKMCHILPQRAKQSTMWQYQVQFDHLLLEMSEMVVLLPKSSEIKIEIIKYVGTIIHSIGHKGQKAIKTNTIEHLSSNHH